MNPIKLSSDIPDFDLWSAFVDDSREAFSLIYQNNIKDLYNYGMKILPNENLIEDCIQELFIDIWNHRKTLSTPHNIKFYLLKALKFKLNRTFQNETQRWQKIKKDFIENTAQVVLPFEDKIIDEQITEEKKHKLQQALEKLPVRQQEIIHLLFFKKLSYDEISEMMSINLRSVYTLSWKALSALKKSILSLLIYIFYLLKL